MKAAKSILAHISSNIDYQIKECESDRTSSWRSEKMAQRSNVGSTIQSRRGVAVAEQGVATASLGGSWSNDTKHELRRSRGFGPRCEENRGGGARRWWWFAVRRTEEVWWLWDERTTTWGGGVTALGWKNDRRYLAQSAPVGLPRWRLVGGGAGRWFCEGVYSQKNSKEKEKRKNPSSDTVKDFRIA